MARELTVNFSRSLLVKLKKEAVFSSLVAAIVREETQKDLQQG
jgi:hypothetical protein